jgi:hypothetical protein
LKIKVGWGKGHVHQTRDKEGSSRHFNHYPGSKLSAIEKHCMRYPKLMTIVHVPQVFLKYFYYLENDVMISNGT